MTCLTIRPLVFTSSFFTPKSLVQPKPFFFSSKPFRSSVKMSQTVEHIVLFNVKDDIDPSKVNSMVNGLSGLISIDRVLHLTTGPILRNRSSSLKFTHILHSRYKTKEDLINYMSHPKHLNVINEWVFPICDDIMAVDWVADLDGPLVPSSGSAIRISFLNLKEGLGESEKREVLGVIGGLKDRFGSIDQISFGECFSPESAKGFSIASLAIFPGLSELDALDSNEEAVKEQKEKVKDLLESVIVVDYVLPPP